MAWYFWNKNKNWGRLWGRLSDIVAVMLPEINSWETILENLLSMRVFEWLVILIGFKIYDIKEFEARGLKIHL